jgi:multiple sugar transport system permease protein
MSVTLTQRIGSTAVRAITVVVFCILLAFPFYWMFITTFKRTQDLYNLENNPFIFNMKPTLHHLEYLIVQTDFVRWGINTLIVGVLVTIIP